MPLPWFRFYSEALKDRKISRVASRIRQPRATIIGVWATLLALANDSPERGCLMIAKNCWMTLAEIQAETGLDEGIFIEILVEFDHLGMTHNVGKEGEIRLIITNFHKRNFKSDNSTPRVQKHRAQSDETITDEANETLPGNVTPSLQKQPCNAPDTDQDTEPDTEKDSASKNRSPPPRPPPKPAKKPKKPIPPAVRVFQDAAHRFPAKSWWGKVVAAVGEAEADLAFWGRVVENYVGCGWNAGNVKTMLEFYRRREIPTVGKQRKKQPGQFTDAELEEARRASLAEDPIDVAAFLGEGA